MDHQWLPGASSKIADSFGQKNGCPRNLGSPVLESLRLDTGVIFSKGMAQEQIMYPCSPMSFLSSLDFLPLNMGNLERFERLLARCIWRTRLTQDKIPIIFVVHSMGGIVAKQVSKSTVMNCCLYVTSLLTIVGLSLRTQRPSI